MKFNLSIVIGILALLLMIMAAPVAAAGTASGSAAVTGNPKAAVSIALNQSTVYLDLDPAAAQPITNLTQALIVSSNGPFGITVEDNSGRAGFDRGYMGNYTGGGYIAQPNDTNLTFPLGITGTANGTTGVQIVTPPIDGPVGLYSGTQKVSSQWLMPTTVSQEVTFSDAVLTLAGYSYRIDLQFTITAT
jgi:hypothetical protein